MENQSNKEIALKTLKEQADNLLAQIKNLQVDYEAIKRAYDLLAGSGDQTSLLPQTPEVKTDEFGHLTLQPAILKLLADRPENAFRPIEVTQILRRGGIKSSSDNFLNIVNSTLLRLTKKGFIEQIKTEGVRGTRYKAKDGGLA